MFHDYKTIGPHWHHIPQVVAFSILRRNLKGEVVSFSRTKDSIFHRQELEKLIDREFKKGSGQKKTVTKYRKKPSSIDMTTAKTKKFHKAQKTCSFVLLTCSLKSSHENLMV